MSDDKWSPEKALGELLAVIHRDGGHYQLEHGDTKATEDAIDIIYKLREREQNAGEAVAIWAVRGGDGRLVPCGNEESARLTAETYGWKIVPTYTRPAQAVSVPSDEAIRAFLHESEGLLIASEDELLPLIREAVVALASACAAPAGDGGDHA